MFRNYPKLPKISIAAAGGYVVGQWLYVLSGDCSGKFEKFAPESYTARVLRSGGFTIGNDRFFIQYVPEDTPSSASEPQEPESGDIPTYEGYLMPSTERRDMDRILIDSTNTFDALINYAK